MRHFLLIMVCAHSALGFAPMQHGLDTTVATTRQTTSGAHGDEAALFTNFVALDSARGDDGKADRNGVEEVPADTTLALEQRNRASSELSAAERRLSDLTTRLTAAATYDAALTSSVRRMEADLQDATAELSSVQLQLANLRQGGPASDVLSAALQSEINGLISAVQEVQNRIVAGRNQQVDVLTQSLERGNTAKELAEEQVTLSQDIRLYVRRVAALSEARGRENGTMADTEHTLAVTQSKLNALQAASAQTQDSMTRKQVAVSESVAKLAEQKRDVDKVSSNLRIANIAIVAEVDTIIRRRDDIQLKRDSMRRQLSILDVVIRQLGQTLQARKDEYSDTAKDASRVQRLLGDRMKDNAASAEYMEKLHRESAKLDDMKGQLEKQIPALQEQLSNLSTIRERFTEQITTLSGAIGAETAAIENLRATRTALRQRLLDMQKEIALQSNQVRKLKDAVLDANETSLDLFARMEEAEKRCNVLLSKVGNIQSQLSRAQEQAKFEWLQRRGECQCEELRMAGASAGTVAQCMRKCADAIIVSKTVLMEMSQPSSTGLPAFRFASVEASTSVETLIEAQHHGILQAVRLEADAETVATKLVNGAGSSGSLSRFAAMEGKDSTVARLADTQRQHAVSMLDSMEHTLELCRARLDNILTDENMGKHARVAQLSDSMKRKLDAADSTMILSHVPTYGHVSTARFRAVNSELVHSEQVVYADPLAAVTSSKAADFRKRADLLEQDLNAKQSSLSQMETRRQLLSNQLAELQRRIRVARQDIEDVQATLQGSNAGESDGMLASLRSRRDILRRSLEELRPQAAAIIDKASVMKASLDAADSAMQRLQSTVTQMRSARDGLKEEMAMLERAVASLKFNSQSRRQELDNAADDLHRSDETAARVRRRMEEHLAELQREEASIEGYLTFMLDANSKLKAHVQELRSRKDDLLSAEAAISTELGQSDAKMKKLLSEQGEVSTQIERLVIDISIARKNLTDMSERLLEADETRSAVTQAAADTALERDKLRAEHIRYAEEVTALRRQLSTTVRRLQDLNATLTDVKADMGDKERMKADMVNALVDVQQGISAANSTLHEGQQGMVLVEKLLHDMSADVDHARHRLTAKQSEISRYSKAYQKLLRKLGRMNDLSVGEDSGADPAALRAMVAEKEAQAQATTNEDYADIAELMGDWSMSNGEGASAPVA